MKAFGLPKIKVGIIDYGLFKLLWWELKEAGQELFLSLKWKGTDARSNYNHTPWNWFEGIYVYCTIVLELGIICMLHIYVCETNIIDPWSFFNWISENIT